MSEGLVEVLESLGVAHVVPVDGIAPELGCSGLFADGFWVVEVGLMVSVFNVLVGWHRRQDFDCW